MDSTDSPELSQWPSPHRDDVEFLARMRIYDRNEHALVKHSPAPKPGDEPSLSFDLVRLESALASLQLPDRENQSIAAIDLLSMLVSYPDLTISHLTPDLVPVICQLIDSSYTLECVLNLLGMMNWLNSEFSLAIADCGIILFFCDQYEMFDDQILNQFFTVFGNVFLDIRDVDVVPGARLFDLVLTYPIQNWSANYTWFLSTMFSLSGLPSHIAHQIVTILINTVIDEGAEAIIKGESLRCLRRMLGSDFRAIVCEHVLKFVPFLEQMLQCPDYFIVLETLRICSICLDISPAFCSCMLQIDLCSALQFTIGLSDTRIVLESIRALCLYIQNSGIFGEDQAELFVGIPKSVFDDGSFDTKLGLVDLYRLLVPYISNEQLIPLDIVEEICDFGDEDVIVAKTATYRFLVCFITNFDSQSDLLAPYMEIFRGRLLERIDEDCEDADSPLHERAQVVRALLLDEELEFDDT
jgi:hypothetical protein